MLLSTIVTSATISELVSHLVLSPLTPRLAFGSKLLNVPTSSDAPPLRMIMRVAVGIHGSDLDRVIETYNLMSKRHFTLRLPHFSMQVHRTPSRAHTSLSP